ncbi:MAG TPA: F0F1 ATP synthase subunit delta [Woeseiaceae bacterium]|nr:F0F1 ATP synthase subunit delta [Woeseiaceae bacterium]
MADNHTIARPYAEAAFEWARQTGALVAWSEGLRLGGELMADGRAAAFLANPRLTDAERLEFLTGLFRTAGGDDGIFAGSNAAGTNFIKLLLEYERVPVLPEMAELFEKLKARVENTIDVTVTTATRLSDAQRTAIVEALRKRLGREVHLEVAVDGTLIGGAIIRADDIVIDGSLRSRLDRLSNAMVA